MQIKGVYGLHEPHFWTLCTDYYVGTLRVQLAPDADSTKILHYVRSIFIQVHTIFHCVYSLLTVILKGWCDSSCRSA